MFVVNDFERACCCSGRDFAGWNSKNSSTSVPLGRNAVPPLADQIRHFERASFRLNCKKIEATCSQQAR
jgi:hypothetical protein